MYDPSSPIITDELITVKEYNRRRETGELDPSEAQYFRVWKEDTVLEGFIVKLKTPKVSLFNGLCNCWMDLIKN